MSGKIAGSNCHRGSLKPRRKFSTPMTRPRLIHALMVTRLVPVSSEASSVEIMSAASMRSRRYCAPDRSSAAVWEAGAYGLESSRRSLGCWEATGEVRVKVLMSNSVCKRSRRVAQIDFLGREKSTKLTARLTGASVDAPGFRTVDAILVLCRLRGG